MNVAIIGMGLLGRTLADELHARGITYRLFPHDDLDITDADDVDLCLSHYDVAVNTAAFHNLAGCESDPERAYAVNVDGAKNVASVLPTVYISSDYALPGDGPHEEVLPGKQPPSVYGRTKLAGEIVTLDRGGIAVRVSGLAGRYDSHKGRAFIDRIADDEYHPIKLPSDQVFSPTWAPDAAARIVDLALMLADGEEWDLESGNNLLTPPEGIYHAANAGSVSWAGYAEEILSLLRRKRHVIPYAAHDPLRPRNSVLLSTRLPPLRSYKLALNDWEAFRFERIRQNAVSPLRGQ